MRVYNIDGVKCVIRDDFMQMWGMSKMNFYRMIRGGLPHVRIGRQILVPVEKGEKFVRRWRLRHRPGRPPKKRTLFSAL